MMSDLKTALVNGANKGRGLEAGHLLAHQGITVVMRVRSGSKGRTAVRELQ